MLTFQNILLVGLGGSAGAVGRYLVTLLLYRHLTLFPVHTLIVNLLGCLIIGVLVGVIDSSLPLPSQIRLLLITGFCGAFTTMSAFIFELDQLFRGAQVFQALFYILLTMLGCITLFMAGYASVKFIFHLT